MIFLFFFYIFHVRVVNNLNCLYFNVKLLMLVLFIVYPFLNIFDICNK